MAELALRRQPGRLVGHPAQDGDVLGQHPAVVELQRRDVALGIDLAVVAAVLGGLGLQVDLDPLELDVCLMQCDVMALSSDTEQMPLVVLEAMDAGLPIASTDVGDVRHMVSQENQPYVVNGLDTALGGALRTLVMDPAARKAVGMANRQRLRQDYQARTMVAAYEALFREAAGAGTRGRTRNP